RRDQLEYLTARGVTVIGGTRQGLRAIDRLARSLAPPSPPRPTPPAPTVTVASLLGGRARPTIHEHDAQRWRAAAGVPTVHEVLCVGRADALAAAKLVGYPVVLKLVSDDVPHRSDLGLVAVGLRDESEVGEAWDRLSAVSARSLAGASVGGFVV